MQLSGSRPFTDITVMGNSGIQPHDLDICNAIHMPIHRLGCDSRYWTIESIKYYLKNNTAYYNTITYTQQENISLIF